MRIFLAYIFILVSVLAEDPVVSTRWIAKGFTYAEEKDADLTVFVTYAVPGIITETETFPFKQFWAEIREYADGSESVQGRPFKSSLTFRDGQTGGMIGGANVDVSNEGIAVKLDLSWGGDKSGNLNRKVFLKWSDTAKTIKDKKVEINITVKYSNKNKTSKQKE